MLPDNQLPRYVLRSGPGLAGPDVMSASEGESKAISIFGFSGKPQYDAFLGHSVGLLTPYPLVKRYLQDQLDLSGDALKLVVLDATDPAQSIMYAATMQSVIEAMGANLKSMNATHQMTKDEAGSSFRCVLLN